jgi:4-amino-4-deoxy-L-arabinose transferase-like glycosyltransferase
VSRAHVALIAAATAAPRLVALGWERSAITREYVEKSDMIANVFADTGTFGFVPGEPTAYTQPLYALFLTPFHLLGDRHWLAVGLVQVGLAVLTAVLVYAIGLRLVAPRWALAAAVVTTLHPYLVWHDVHLDREILDQPLAAAVTLAALRAASRPTLAAGALLGALLGVATLGNARLLLLPLALALWLLWAAADRRAAVVPALAAVVAAAAVVAPWVARNAVQVGCAALTTDTRALWKANNEHTYETLAEGLWIDDVPELPGAPPTPELAGDLWLLGRPVPELDECAQMELYRREVLEFWREHPGEKARLAAQATGHLWSPVASRTSGRSDPDGLVDVARRWVEPLWAVPVFLLALVGLPLAGRRFAALALVLLGYGTLLAMVFAGTTRYRVPWDFVLVLLAAIAAEALARRRAERRR